MSYCRFSSDNWWSDVYVYKSAEGWVTHVAGRRGIISPVPDITFCRFSDWLFKRSGPVYHKDIRRTTYANPRFAAVLRAWARFAILWERFIHRTSLRLIPMRPIGLAHDGETLHADTPGECADTLEYLRSLGYRVPQRAIDALWEESVEEP